MGEATNTMQDFCGKPSAYEELTQSWEKKTFQVEEDKILAKVTLSTIYQIMPLIWKGVEEGSRGSTILFQSKETTLGLRGSILEESGILPSEEGTKI
jgi:hypothetical protein